MKTMTIRLVACMDGNIVSGKPKMHGSFWQSGEYHCLPPAFQIRLQYSLERLLDPENPKSEKKSNLKFQSTKSLH